MASCNFRKPAAGASVRLCCLMILAITIIKVACATTVLHNKSGRDLVLIIPQHHLNIEAPAGQSVELQGEQQHRGVVIRDVQTGAVAGPLNLPDSPSLEAVQFDPSTYTTDRLSANVQGTVSANFNPGGGGGGLFGVRFRAV